MDGISAASPVMSTSRTNSVCLSEGDMLSSDEDKTIMETSSRQSKNIVGVCRRPDKRKGDEEDDEGTWNTVKSKEKKWKSHVEKIEMYISSSEQQLPKAFALAKLFKENGITDIERVKYVNPYKVRLDIKSGISIDRLENCKAIIDKGWRIQMAMEKNFSYGVIRDVDLEMTEADIYNRITCPGSFELISVFRLNRRSASSTGWARSESVRLCFKGDQLPTYVSVDGLRIRVDPYVFPVSQCSFCWQLGHTAKKCPSPSKVVCPKCGDNHENCATLSFKCVNCGGAHMSMYKGCPAFIKEKRLRDIMAEYNCTYRKALTINVPQNTQKRTETSKLFAFNATRTPSSMTSFPLLEKHEQSSVPLLSQRKTATYASVLRTKADVHTQPELRRQASRQTPNKQRYHNEETSFEFNLTPNLELRDRYERHIPTKKKEKEVKFSELLNRLKEIIFMRDTSLEVKMKNGLKCCIEWLILVVVENFADWPILKNILDLFMNYGQ